MMCFTMLLGEIFGMHNACRWLKNQETFVGLSVALNNGMTGHQFEKVQFSFFTQNGKYVECLLCVNKKLGGDDTVTDVFCFLQLASPELKQALHVQRIAEQTTSKRSKALGYNKRQINNPLSGITFSRKMMEGTVVNEDQQQLLDTSAQCQRQLNKILDDTDLDDIIDGYLDLEMVIFTMQEVFVASVSQVMIQSDKNGIRIVNEIHDDIMEETFYGDRVRLQQILADFLVISVNFTKSGGQLSITANMKKDKLAKSVHLARLEFRITHVGDGVPESLLNQMYGGGEDPSEEGVSLLVSRKLLRLMNGDVHYLREADKSTFILTVELPTAPK